MASFTREESPKKRNRVAAQWEIPRHLLETHLKKVTGHPKIETDPSADPSANTPTDYIIIAHGMTETDELLDLNFFQPPMSVSVLFYCLNGNKTNAK